MNEEIFNQAKIYSPSCLYWDINGYRVYINCNKDYEEYCKKTNLTWTAYKATEDSDFSDKNIDSFLILKDDDYQKLNIEPTQFNFANFYLNKNMFEKVINAILNLGKTSSNLIIGPCCKCGLKDTWNSIKDNNWFCYQHCDY